MVQKDKFKVLNIPKLVMVAILGVLIPVLAYKYLEIASVDLDPETIAE